MTAYSANLQRVIYQAVIGTSIPDLVKVVDRPLIDPDSSEFPYVQIGASQALPADATGSDGTERFVDLHVWSRKRHQLEVKELLDALRTVFHDQLLSVSGLTTAHFYVDAERVLDDPDGLTRHGVLTLKINCQE